ncbi:amino acid adenylation domain-containing protein [Streptomyces chattanoogensis]
MTPTDADCLHRLFERRAAQAGGRTAVSDGSRHHTYAELNRSANRLAHRLWRLGAGPQTFVGVCSDRSADLVLSLLAVLKSGAAYVPLDPAYPAERTRFTLSDTGCRLVIGQERHRTAFADAGVEFLAVESLTGLDESDDNPETGVRAGHPAYVIHTSGSTGTPKGVVVTHANAVRLFDSCRDEFAIVPDDVWTLFHSCAFDFSVWELWGALLHGGRLVIVPYATSRSPESFLQLLLDQGVTVLSQTPTAFRQLIRAAEAEGFPESALRLVVFGGEALEPASLRPWIERYGAARPRLVNMYGITETTVHVTLRDITAADCAAPRSPIGRPLPDLQLHLLDDDMQPVPAGEVGEIYVGGAGVTRGYLNRPELTAERFVPDPFGAAGERLYRTGDLAVRHPDGELEFRGRGDDQVQLRGFRIELGEVEAALAGLDGVREAAVLLRKDDLGEAGLVGYAVLAPGSAATPAQLRQALAGRLPAHMVPARCLLLDAFPLTPNGKLDRRALPAPPARTDSPASASGTATGAASGAAEILHKVWATALDVDEVPPDANFFALGGDSITALRVAGMAREAGLPLTVEQLFRYPTLAGLLGAGAGQEPGHGLAPAAPPAPAAARDRGLLRAEDAERLPAGVTDAYPPASLQLGMIFESQLSGDPTLYHDLVSVRIAGPLDRAALRRALDLLASRHEVLRTSFDLATFSEPLQLVHDRVTVPLYAHPSAPEEALPVWWHTEWQHAFDFGSAPLWRCHVHDHGDDGFRLSVSAHHSILDGWSFSLLLTELIGEYERELLGGAATAALPALPYRAYVEHERAEGRSADARTYWEQVVRAPVPLPLPGPSGTPTAPAPDPQVRAVLPAATVAAVKRCADRLSVPAKCVFLAAHVWALRAATRTPDITTGIVVNGRPESADAERTLGLFLNSVPVRTALTGGTWQELARSLFAAERSLLPFRRFPLAEIQGLAGTAPFAVLFNYTDFRSFDTLAGLRELRVTDWWFSDRTSVPVVVEVGRRPMDTDWELTVRADPAKVAPGIGDRLVPLFLEALRRLCEDPSDAY